MVSIYIYIENPTIRSISIIRITIGKGISLANSIHNFLSNKNAIQSSSLDKTWYL